MLRVQPPVCLPTARMNTWAHVPAGAGPTRGTSCPTGKENGIVELTPCSFVWYLDLIVEAIFVMDIILNFFTGVPSMCGIYQGTLPVTEMAQQHTRNGTGSSGSARTKPKPPTQGSGRGNDRGRR